MKPTAPLRYNFSEIATTPAVAYLFLVRSHAHVAVARCYRRRDNHTTANFLDGGGMKLFVRRVQAHDAGVMLAQNGRWIDAKWSPDSQFLAVIDHPDGHIADVYVFGITAADAEPPTVALFYRTPNASTYDVQWDVVGWHTENREIVLKQEVRDQNAGTQATHSVVAKIGTQPPKFELPK